MFARTDAQGNYNRSLPLGTYRVEATHPDYRSKNATATVEEGITARANFALEALPKQVAPQGLDPLVVAAIGIGVVVVIAAVAGYFVMKRRKKEEEIVGPTMPPQAPPPPPGPP